MTSALENNQPFFADMARTLLYWLNYTNNTCKVDILKEELLRVPLSEFIERKVSGSIHLEVVMDEDNTDKHIDFTYNAKSKGQTIKGNIEVKYVQDLTRRGTEKQRYFDDICRLASTRKRATNNIMIVFGRRELFNTNFKRLVDGRKKIVVYDDSNTDIKPEGTYSKWFSFNVNGASIIETRDFETYYSEFARRHKVRKISRIKTELLSIQEDANDYRSFVVAIWKITRLA